MEELLEIRSCIQDGHYAEALNLIGEMEEMSKDDKISKIESYLEILLLHLIKQQAEKRTTRSWNVSIKNAIDRIGYTNKRRKAGGFYLARKELYEAIEESWTLALRRASLETLEGRYDESQLARMIDEKQIKETALEIIAIN
ncbi:DUF29 domain-containing protein [bacterium]|nr:DUF29 domain-containing protein [bacterium]